eukprot:TRINITY_DN2759_c0_g1_i2.p1 TRINITY_DN2759_c0_g1~~TRINITY_DN2759_c0_g1_i2.p1  ORF type:complete len:210 (+),score=38.65 TRINITY_DN2759_c0_g1_i2:190-819(+)
MGSIIVDENESKKREGSDNNKNDKKIGIQENNEGNSKRAFGEIPRFLADDTVTRTARWLRVLGFDTTLEQNVNINTLISHVASEKRVLLTRNSKIARRREVKNQCLLLLSNHVQEHVREIVTHFGISLDDLPSAAPNCPLKRCVKCNQNKFNKLSESEVQGRVPPKTLNSANLFFECVYCRQVFWPGSTYSNAQQHFMEFCRSKKESRE